MMPSSKSLEEKIRQMQPLIIMGMHRSGTSLTVRLLKDLGIYMGDSLSRDAEAIYFQKINRRIYNAVGSKWSDIDALRKAMCSEQFIQEQTEKVLNSLFPTPILKLKIGIADYFGPQLWRTISAGNTVFWGWKDPRTSFTFPIWLRVFPNARFLHLVRNGIDVAISTHRRGHKQQRHFLKRTLRLDYSPLTLDFKYCFQLWEAYIAFIMEYKGIIPPEHFLELRYEDLLAAPEEKLSQITSFMGYPVTDDVLNAACEQINRGRLDNTDHAKPYQEMIPALASNPLMLQLGYSYTTSNRKIEATNES